MIRLRPTPPSRPARARIQRDAPRTRAGASRRFDAGASSSECRDRRRTSLCDLRRLTCRSWRTYSPHLGRLARSCPPRSDRRNCRRGGGRFAIRSPRSTSRARRTRRVHIARTPTRSWCTPCDLRRRRSLRASCSTARDMRSMCARARCTPASRPGGRHRSRGRSRRPRSTRCTSMRTHRRRHGPTYRRTARWD